MRNSSILIVLCRRYCCWHQSERNHFVGRKYRPNFAVQNNWLRQFDYVLESIRWSFSFRQPKNVVRIFYKTYLLYIIIICILVRCYQNWYFSNFFPRLLRHTGVAFIQDKIAQSMGENWSIYVYRRRYKTKFGSVNLSYIYF